MRTKTILALATVPAELAVAVGSAEIAYSASRTRTDSRECTVVGNQRPVDEEPIDGDGDQPFIGDDPAPATAEDFLRDSQSGPGTGEETAAPFGDGAIEENDGWTATGPSR